MLKNSLVLRVLSGIFILLLGVPGVILFSYLYVDIAFYTEDIGPHGDYYFVFDLDYLALYATLYFLIGFCIFPLFLGSNYWKKRNRISNTPISITRVIMACLVIFPTTLLLFNYDFVFPDNEFLEQISLHTSLFPPSTLQPVSLFNHFFVLPPANNRFFGLSLWAQQSVYSLSVYVLVTSIFLRVINAKCKSKN